jgi:hypothetical protein
MAAYSANYARFDGWVTGQTTAVETAELNGEWIIRPSLAKQAV